MKNMVIKLPEGCCPKCFHTQFIVFEGQTNLYLTNENIVVDNKELDYKAIGVCCNCGAKFKMMQTPMGFIPLTKLREIIYKDITPQLPDEYEEKYIKNPMEDK